MPGSQDEIDWENMTNQDLHDKFAQMMSEQVHDIKNIFREAVEKLDGVEKMIDTKLDAKFNDLIARLPPVPAAVPAQPPPQRRARRILCLTGQVAGIGAPAAAVAAAAASDVGQYDDYEGDYKEEVEREAPYEQPAGRPRPTFDKVDNNHPLKYAMMNMCLN